MTYRDAAKLKPQDKVFVKETGENLVVEKTLEAEGSVYVTATGPLTGRQEWQHTLLAKR